MRRHELRTAKGYLEALSRAMEDCHWWIDGVVTPEISEDGKTATYLEEKDQYNYLTEKREKVTARSHQFTSDGGGLRWDAGNFPHCFGWQQTHDEDCHHGQMLFPLEGKEYLLVSFNC